MSTPAVRIVPEPRPSVAAMTPYIPGEQPADPGIVKLNTNENPYPPSPRVIEAIHSLGEAALRKYPDPLCRRLREAVAARLGIEPEGVLATNGSDEILKMAVEAFVRPGDAVGYLWPTYSLYPVFVEEAGGREVRLDWSESGPTQEQALEGAPTDLRVLFVANPNPPIGRTVGLDDLRRLATRLPATLLVVDEAYVAFGGESAVALVREGFANVLVTRTFSKSHGLAGMRVGLGLGVPELMRVLFRVKDSYNVGVAAQAAALAAWQDEEYTADVVRRVRATREWTAERLRALGFSVTPSHGNFLFARRADAREVFAALRARRVLVRYFDTPRLSDGLRITIGTNADMKCLVDALQG